MTGRAGFFKYQRNAIDRVQDEDGAVAVQVFLTLLANARIETGIVRRGGVDLVLLRGHALFSVRTFAEKLKRSPSAVHRAMKTLVTIGEIQLIEAGRRLKRGRGTLPTIVKITNFELYRWTPAAWSIATRNLWRRSAHICSHVARGSVFMSGFDARRVVVRKRDADIGVRPYSSTGSAGPDLCSRSFMRSPRADVRQCQL